MSQDQFVALYPLVGVYSIKAKPTMVYPPPGTVVVCVLVCGSAVVVLVMVRRYYNRSKSTHASDAAGLQTRNVVYDEVVLSPTSSSVIPTEPNTAYVTHHHNTN
ncbi:hypothetical protein GBAR_LOCUS2657 [Geodia barretti]|uniref:Uncharacterized protein n=2 Tax=Geodia barretti TaxID=519541 RepID=A0AA35R0B9_GEOBA|nr:hypothetical protein GBAR_LOCUS2657 [Geodia barretti]